MIKICHPLSKMSVMVGRLKRLSLPSNASNQNVTAFTNGAIWFLGEFLELCDL